MSPSEQPHERKKLTPSEWLLKANVQGTQNFSLLCDACIADPTAIQERMEKIARTVQTALQEINCPPSDPKDMAKAGKMLASLRALYEKRTGSSPDTTIDQEFIQLFALIQARVHRGCKHLQLQELLSEETPSTTKEPPTAQPWKEKPQTPAVPTEIGLADAEEGPKTKGKSVAVPQTQNAPQTAGEYAVDLGETGPTEQDRTGDQMDETDWAKVLGTDPQSMSKGTRVPSKGKGTKHA